MPREGRPQEGRPPERRRGVDSESSTTSIAARLLPQDKIDVLQLLQGRDEVLLDHRGTEYRLRVTRQGKLLLTK